MIGQQNILIIDPEEVSGQLLCSHIVALGHHALACADVAAALTKLQQERYDAVFLAWPKGKSREAQNGLSQLQTAVPFLPILLCTPAKHVRDAAASLTQNIQGYILRPYYFDEVAAQLRNLQQAKEIANVEDETIQTLYAVQSEMVISPDEPTVMEKICNVLVDTFGYAAAAFWVVDPHDHSGVLTLFRARGFPDGSPRNPIFSVPEGYGVVGRVFETKREIIISDLFVEEDVVWQDLVQLKDWRGMIAVPMLFKRDALGVLVCYTREVRPFSSLEKERLQALANLTSIDYKNANQFDKWRKIERASEQLNKVRKLETAVSMITTNALKIAEAMGATLCVYDAAKRCFLPDFSQHTGSIGQDLVHWHALTSDWEQLLQKVLEQKKVLLTDVRAVETRRLVGLSLQSQLRAAGVRALVALRLDGNEDPVGVLLVYYVNLHPYANPDENHEKKTPLNIYSEQAAAALGRAKFFRRRANEQRFIQRFAQKVSIIPTRQDVDENTWQETLLRLCELTGAQRAMLGLRDEWGMMQFGVPKGIHSDYLAEQISLGEQSMEGQVLANQLAYALVRDLPDEAHWGQLDNPLLAQTRSKIVVPITRNESEERLGLIALESDEPDVFDQLDLNLVTDLAGHIGIDVTGKQLEDFGRHRIRQLEAFIGESYNFTAIQFVRERLLLLLEEIRQAEGYDMISLHMYDPYWKRFDPPILAGKFLSLDEFVYASPMSLSYKPEQDAFFTMDPMKKRFVFGAFIENEAIESSAMLRLRDEQQVVGLLFVYQRQQHFFGGAERERLQGHGDRVRQVILEANFLRLLVSRLRDGLELDIVRLHLYDSEPRPTWSYPVSSGQLLSDEPSWSPHERPMGAVGRIMACDKLSQFVLDAQESLLFQGDFVARERIRASGYVQLRVDGKPLGLLFVSRRQAKRWRQAEIEAVRSFGVIAAVAIQNRRQLREYKNKTMKLASLQKASEDIVLAGLDLTAVSRIIVSKAVTLTRTHIATLYLLQGNSLEAEAVWGLPKEEEREWRRQNGRLPLDGSSLPAYLIEFASQPDGEHAILRPDTTLDSRFINIDGYPSLSTLSVVLRDVQNNQKPIGVLSVSHPERDGLDETDRDLLMLLANIAAVALKHASRREVVATTEMIALQGLFGANWWHTAHQKSFSIKQRVHLLERYLTKPEQYAAQIQSCLQGIAKAAEEIDNIPTKGVLPNVLQEKAQPIGIDDLVLQTVQPLCRNLPDVSLTFDLNATDRQVAIHPLLFDLAIEKLVTNALQAMGRQGKISIRSELRPHNLVEIQIVDSGPGIPDEIAAHFLSERIAKRKGEDGQGLGGLLARFVFNRYGGHLHVAKNTTKGVTLAISLPLVEDSS
ncbi:MAG: GAF domain-containing protein [Chloroflexota bacterium]